MAYKYFYIDDNTEEANNTLKGFDGLEIIVSQPQGDWEDEIAKITNNDFSECSGLILDLRLNEYQGVNKENAKYNGITLAQELRTLAKQSEINDIPIILLSAEHNIERSLDQTGIDLFDLKIGKGSLNTIKFQEISKKLNALSEGYVAIKREKEKNNAVNQEYINDILNVDCNEIDNRIIEKITNLNSSPVHNLSSFLINHLLDVTGPLISEDILATRLGIDKNASNEGWQHVVNALKATKFNGVFSSGWQRWWMYKVENWWQELTQNQADYLYNLNAEERVSIINEKLNLNCIAIKKVEKASSNYFWTNCYGSGVSIDKKDGLLIDDQNNIYPWEEKIYISIQEAINPKRTVNYWKEVAISEKDNLDNLKRMYQRERIRK